jgi:hypothetical protein
MGVSVASAGDVNGDGFADIVLGAELHGGTGRAFVHLVGPTPLPATAPGGWPVVALGLLALGGAALGSRTSRRRV